MRHALRTRASLTALQRLHDQGLQYGMPLARPPSMWRALLYLYREAQENVRTEPNLRVRMTNAWLLTGR